MNTLIKHSSRATLAALGMATLALFSLEASAALPVPKQEVHFADLDLTKQRDTQRLYSRLRTASREVCKNLAQNKSVRGREAYRGCTSRALNDAVAVIGSSSLTALHASKSDMKLAQSNSDATPRS